MYRVNGIVEVCWRRLKGLCEVARGCGILGSWLVGRSIGVVNKIF